MCGKYSLALLHQNLLRAMGKLINIIYAANIIVLIIAGFSLVW